MKKKKIMGVSLVVGICCFATAAFANYSTPNGYDALKNGIKSSLGLKNYTLETTLSIDLNGTELHSLNHIEETDAQNGVFHIKETSKSFDDDAAFSFIEYTADNETVYVSGDTSNQNYSYHTYRNDDGYFYNPGSLSSFDTEDDMNQKVIRFGELFVDTMIGDLKNNVIYVDSTDEDSTYNISLTSIQIPEIVNAGISLIAASAANEIGYYDENGDFVQSGEAKAVMDLGDSPTVKSAELTFTVSNDGILKSINGVGVIEGNGSTMQVNIGYSLSNIGTTEPERVPEDIKAAAIEDFTALNPDYEYTED